MSNKLTKVAINVAKNSRKYCTRRPQTLTKTKFENGVKTITMCDQKTRNSLSILMMQNLIQNINENNDQTDMRALIISAEGPIFSAGHNLKELTQESGRSQHQLVFDLANQLMCSIIDSPFPVIAKVDGLAAAAGCQLVAQCDIAVCTENSTFSTPGANFGIFCSTPGVALARSVNKATALKMLLTGQAISALEARNSGLVTTTCVGEKLNDEVDAICEAIKSKSRSVIELGKRFYYEQVQLDVKKAYELGGSKMVENLQLTDGIEGIKSFAEKRKAVWKHC